MLLVGKVEHLKHLPSSTWKYSFSWRRIFISLSWCLFCSTISVKRKGIDISFKYLKFFIKNSQFFRLDCYIQFQIKLNPNHIFTPVFFESREEFFFTACVAVLNNVLIIQKICLVIKILLSKIFFFLSSKNNASSNMRKNFKNIKFFQILLNELTNQNMECKKKYIQRYKN